MRSRWSLLFVLMLTASFSAEATSQTSEHQRRSARDRNHSQHLRQDGPILARFLEL
jgi:hypothetical protein